MQKNDGDKTALQSEVLQRYGDIIDRPYRGSTTRKRMSMVDRAAQFSAFAALTGHGAALQETARLTEADRDLSEDARVRLDRRLELLLQLDRPQITVTHFVPDEKKDGGAYAVHRGILKRMDPYRRSLLFEDGTCIAIDHIVELESVAFSMFDEL